MPSPSEIWIIDTSSLIAIREQVVPPEARAPVFARLTSMVTAGTLVFPHEVFEELSNRTGARSKQPDDTHDWAKGNLAQATRHGRNFDAVKDVLADRQVARVVDHRKTTGVEEADPYLLALAMRLRPEHLVVIVTDDIRDQPIKLSLSSACGLLRIVSLPLLPFLEQQGIHPPK